MFKYALRSQLTVLVPKKNPNSSSVGVQYKASRRKKTTQTKSISLTQLSGVDVKDASTQTNGTPDVPRNVEGKISTDPKKDEATISTIEKPPKTQSTVSELGTTEETNEGNKSKTELCINITSLLQELLLKTKVREKQIEDSIATSCGQRNEDGMTTPTCPESKPPSATLTRRIQHDPDQKTVDRLRLLVRPNMNEEHILKNSGTIHQSHTPLTNIGQQMDGADRAEKSAIELHDLNETESMIPDAQIKISSDKKQSQTKPRRSKALLLYDSYHDQFDQNKFSKSYFIRKVHVGTIEEAINNKRVVDAIKTFQPDLIVIHLGVKDIKKWGSYPVFINNFKRLISEMLEKTNCKVCFSQIIPIPGSPELNGRIKFANNRMAELIAEARKESRYMNRLYTTANDNLGGYIERYISDNGEALRLSRRGEAKLWLRLRDSLNRMVSFKQIQGNSRSSRQNE